MTTTTKRKPFPPALIARINATCAACIAAGCTTEETIALCRLTVEQWVATKGTFE